MDHYRAVGDDAHIVPLDDNGFGDARDEQARPLQECGMDRYRAVGDDAHIVPLDDNGFGDARDEQARPLRVRYQGARYRRRENGAAVASYLSAETLS